MRFFLIFLVFISFLEANHLSNSSSEYLREHANNPIDWYPWSKEAFLKAKRENKLIFLSIGYSTCHWCHVMNRESFENEKIASILNRYYISIKVDKEEMPHIDSKYQSALIKIRKIRNGWPLSVILTPNREILYIATYIPPHKAYGIEGLDTLLIRLAKLYKNNPKRVKKIIEANRKLLSKKEEKIVIDTKIEKAFIDKMYKRFDKIYKGFDLRPKYPLASHLDLLFDIYLLTKDKRAKEMFFQTLNAMAKGGIYDQIEGGFFRYSTNPDWIVPHFEKMLYTQAKLIPIYTKAYLFTNNSLYKRVVIQTVKESIKRFQKNSLFYSASSAESQGIEGGYFVYKFDEVFKALKQNGFNKKEIKNITEFLDITPVGNFKEGYSNPQINTDVKKPKRLKEALNILRKIREKREFPFIDKKIITSWNAMMIKALFKASIIDANFKKIAFKSLKKLTKTIYKNKILYHQFVEGYPLSIKAYLEDYAFLIDALIEAYENSYDKKYLFFAKELTKEAIKKFYDKNTKEWYLDFGKIRAKSVYQDRYYPTPLSIFLNDLLTIANLSYDREMLKKSKNFIKQQKSKILSNLTASPTAIKALLRLKYEDIIIKSNKKNLLKNKIEIEKIKYPFILTNTQDTNLFVACRTNSCFAFDENLSKIIKSIEK